MMYLTRRRPDKLFFYFKGTDDGTGVKADNTLFAIIFNADKNPGLRSPPTNQGPNQMVMPESELGFSLDYRVSTSCGQLTLADASP